MEALFWAFCIVMFVLWVQATDIRMIISLWIKTRASLKREEQRTRQIEAISKMSGVAQQRLLDSMPEWVDKSDPEEVQAWQQARAETLATLQPRKKSDAPE